MRTHQHTSVGKSQHFSTTLHHHLVRKGVKGNVAAAVSAALVHSAKYAYDRADVGLGLLEKAHSLKEGKEAWKGLKQSLHLLSNPIMAHGDSLAALTRKVAAHRASIGAAGMVMAEVGLKTFGIPHNECALSFAKVSIDAGEIVSGSLAAETVVGGIFAAMSAHAASEDSMDLVTNCFGVPKERQEETRGQALSMRTVLYRP